MLASFALLASQTFRSVSLDVLTSYVCKRVFTTSSGFVIMPAVPPAIPAHKKYQNVEYYLSHGLTIVLRFSLQQTTQLAKGMFIITVRG